ncbi:MAG: MotA/TolQ/ExbB proton channel family protein, partial [Planctomycetota bacterium]
MKFDSKLFGLILLSAGLLAAGTLIAQSPESASTVGSAAAGANPVAAAPGKSLFGIIIAGGPLMIPIGICSFILVLFTFERLVSLRRSQLIPAPFVNRFLDQLSSGELNRESALALCDKSNSMVSRIFRAGVQKWGR